MPHVPERTASKAARSTAFGHHIQAEFSRTTRG
eukprot:CAMPEP_0118838226 /NCGR_PEP_ID=MMETSP1162-20130426/65316_1 /TAXON_ID=33656 /ORGANISM="Phaeocystis Sp, Strain CCMP2710" /LENGTH=32 /DNA_ID= /DNA_START= /DNA_END= /DNA_ORIENTATION=